MAEAKHTADETYTDAELLSLARESYARCLKAGIGYKTDDGIQVTRERIESLKEQIEWLESRTDRQTDGMPRNRIRMARKL